MSNFMRGLARDNYSKLKSFLIHSLVVFIFVLAIAEMLSAYDILSHKGDPAKVEIATKLILACIFIIFISRTGPLLKLKLFGSELEFGTIVTVVGKSNSQEIEIQKLKNDVDGLLALVKPTLAGSEKTDLEGWREMPALGPVRAEDDKNKGRFGGKNVVEPYFLSAIFENKDQRDKVVPITIFVKRTDDGPVRHPVRFFLHETFGRMQDVLVAPRDGRVSLNTLAVGGFTVGAWVVGTDVLLELDLSTLPSAPDAIRFL